MKNKFSVNTDTNPNSGMSSVGFLLIVVNIILSIVGYKVSYFETGKSIVLVEVVLLTIVVSCTIWVIIVARKLNRSPLLWGILTLFFAPISLIVLGYKDIRVPDELKKVYNKFKSDYFLEKLKLKKDFTNGIFDTETYEKKLSNLSTQYDEALNRAMKKAQEEYEKKKIKDVIEKVEGGGSGRYIAIKDNCPACGARISEEAEECSECGLSFR